MKASRLVKIPVRRKWVVYVPFHPWANQFPELFPICAYINYRSIIPEPFFTEPLSKLRQKSFMLSLIL